MQQGEREKFVDILDRVFLREIIDYPEAHWLYLRADWCDQLLGFQIRVVEGITWKIFLAGYCAGKVGDYLRHLSHEINSRHACWVKRTLGPYDSWWRRILREVSEKLTTYPIIEDFEEIKEEREHAGE